MNTKTIIPIAIAIVMAIVAMIVARRIVSQPSMSGENPAGGFVEVIVAAKTIEPGEQIDEKSLKVVRVSPEALGDSMFTPKTGDSLVGRVSRVQIVAQQSIVEPMLAPVGSAAGLPGIIRPGMRAITIQVDPHAGMAAFVEPGHRVDLIGRLPGEGNQGQMTKTLVQNLEILGVGSRLSSTKPPPTDDTEAPADRAAGSLTLLVTPEQAELVDLAVSQGYARIALRGTQDTLTVSSSGVDFGLLRGNPRREPQAIRDLIDLTNTPPVDADPRLPVTPRWTMQIVGGGGSPQTVEFDLPAQSELTPASVTPRGRPTHAPGADAPRGPTMPPRPDPADLSGGNLTQPLDR